MAEEETIPKWVEREIMNIARNGANTRDDNFESDVDIAYTTGMDVIKAGGNMDEAFIEMNLYLSTLD